MGRTDAIYSDPRKRPRPVLRLSDVRRYADKIRIGEKVDIKTLKCNDEHMGQKKEVPRTATVIGVCGRIVRLMLPSGVEDDISLKDYALIRRGGQKGVKHEQFTPERLGNKRPYSLCRY